MMLESRNHCLSCRKGETIVSSTKNNKAISGISEIKIMNKPVLLTDTSILFCVINKHDTVSKIRTALDNYYYKGYKNQKIIFGGRTEGNLRARLKVLEQLGLVITNLDKKTGRVPNYEITNLGLAVQNMFMAGLDLFAHACSNCISERMQTAVFGLGKKNWKEDDYSV